MTDSHDTEASIDLNCDLGEGCPTDRDIIPLISSANIACGFHAGDAETAFATLYWAVEQGIRVGAHPGFPDKDNFGRKELSRSEKQIFQDCVYQIGALQGLAKAAGTELSYVKAHGALYNMACRLPEYARPVVKATALFQLPVLGLPGSQLEILSEGQCRFVAEGFADRRYQADGTLVPRSQSDAMLDNADDALQQILWLKKERGVQTICVHGDNPLALTFLGHLRTALEQHNIAIKPFV